MACSVDGKPAIVQQTSDVSNQHDFMGLVITPVASSFYRLELRKLLLPVTQDMGLYRTEFTHLTDGEVAFGGYRGKPDFRRILSCHSVSPPGSSISDWRERSQPDAQ